MTGKRPGVLKTCLIVVILGLAAGCTSLPVRTDYDPAADFAAFRTYAWLERSPVAAGDPRIDDNPLLHQRVHTAIDAGLQSAGFAAADPATADFLVSYYLTIDRMTSVTYINNYWGYGPGSGSRYYRYNRPGFYPVFSEPVVYAYEQGTLVLDIIQPQGRKLVWRGSTSSELDDDATPEQRQQKLTRAVNALLAEFPPR